MEKRTEVLKKLDSFKFDFMLNNPVTICKNCTLCDEESQNKKNEPWFKVFCYQFVRNLETAEITNSTLSADKKLSRCKSLTYWMYDKVINIYKRSDVIKDDKIIKDLLVVWQKFNDSNVKSYLSSKCSVPNYSEFTNIKEMEKKKIMSDYCENYYDLKKILKVFVSYDNCHIYYDYFRDSLRKYKDTVKNCNEDDFFINKCSYLCDNPDPEDLMNLSNCRIIEISHKKNDYVKKDECKALTKPAPEVMCEPNEIEITEFNFSDNRAIVLILFSLWGIILTFLFLYKMTPFQSWINSKIGKKKIIRNSFNEQSDDETLDADYENLDRNIQNTGYNITYNSNWNSSR
ncbi:PIR Superfamily Protein [Plasmodium ovale curtisi]|uniref:PIR Superfamily Protein n=1 Tax=Plasmodium ovale curtisi TaxID=864141 RepID=A0A1A8WGL6_PLAOA|nr:PIR Superfamily Protein [Plasmodium ovale curtisi]